MISFVTLFLGLSWGVQTVELAAPPPAARVELLLDGESVATDAEPPWRVECDLGAEPAPHRLEAVAYDADGAELARAHQTVNLALRHAGAELALERGPDGRAEAVRVAWESVFSAEPMAGEVRFDGDPLPIVDLARIPLPEHDPDEVHVVSAELTFARGAQARADLAYGGGFGEAVSAENTAVAVATDQGRALRSREDAEGLLTVDGEPLAVLAVEHEHADLVFVVERSAAPQLESLGADLRRRDAAGTSIQPPSAPDRRHGAPTYGPTYTPKLGATPLARAGLRGADRMFLMLPVPQPAPGAPEYQLFTLSQGFTSEVGGSAWILTGVSLPDWGRRRQQLAQAVAVAGIHAASGRRPRAVVLVLGPEPEDASPFSPEAARRFLARLRVPLEVWYVDKSWAAMRRDERREVIRSRLDGPRSARRVGEAHDRGRSDRRDLATADWGTPRDVDSLDALLEEARRLRVDLERQRVLWVDGLHLPGEVALADGRAGFELLE